MFEKTKRRKRRRKNNNGGKPQLENLSQGTRLKYLRQLRYMTKEYVTDYFDLGGERKEKNY